ncbi:MAG: hypothetical protein ACRDE2_08680 [Chitinophagaceae bacterium]
MRKSGGNYPGYPRKIGKKPAKRSKPQKKKLILADYYGALKGIFGDGFKYQNRIRHEWE